MASASENIFKFARKFAGRIVRKLSYADLKAFYGFVVFISDGDLEAICKFPDYLRKAEFLTAEVQRRKALTDAFKNADETEDGTEALLNPYPLFSDGTEAMLNPYHLFSGMSGFGSSSTPTCLVRSFVLESQPLYQLLKLQFHRHLPSIRLFSGSPFNLLHSDTSASSSYLFNTAIRPEFVPFSGMSCFGGFGSSSTPTCLVRSFVLESQPLYQLLKLQFHHHLPSITPFSLLHSDTPASSSYLFNTNVDVAAIRPEFVPFYDAYAASSWRFNSNVAAIGYDDDIDLIRLYGRPAYNGPEFVPFTDLFSGGSLNLFHSDAPASPWLFNINVVPAISYDEDIDAVRLYGMPVQYGPEYAPLADVSVLAVPIIADQFAAIHPRAKETDRAVHIRMDMPGFNRENVIVMGAHNALVVYAWIPQYEDDEGGDLVIVIRLPEKYFEIENTVFAMKKGVLKLFVPKVVHGWY